MFSSIKRRSRAAGIPEAISGLLVGNLIEMRLGIGTNGAMKEEHSVRVHDALVSCHGDQRACVLRLHDVRGDTAAMIPQAGEDVDGCRRIAARRIERECDVVVEVSSDRARDRIG